MKKIKDAVAVKGAYEKNGETKKSFMNVGALFQRDDGSFVLKLDGVPFNFDGWINFYDPKDKPQEQGGGYQDKSRSIPPQKDDIGDDIPW